MSMFGDRIVPDDEKKTFYKRNNNKGIQQWSIITSGDCFWTEEGIVGGKITKSLPTICKPMSVGKKNATTGIEQAEKEAKAKIRMKMDEGYVTDIDQVDGNKRFKPMLAEKYEDYKDKLEFPLWVQRKLDGMRCVITKDMGMRSREGKPIVSAPHIWEVVKHLFVTYPELVLDGELYNSDHIYNDFNKIISLAKKTKPSKEDLKESAEKLEYHIYDTIIDDQDWFSTRNETTKRILRDLPPCIVIVETFKVNDEKMLNFSYQKFLNEGVEGQIIRLDTPYLQKRTKNLLKRKEFIDSEFLIIDIVEGVGNRSGMLGNFRLQMKDGRIFDSNARGNQEYFRELLLNKKDYIGKYATCRYQNITTNNDSESGQKGGVPRFPVVTSIRDYE